VIAENPGSAPSPVAHAVKQGAGRIGFDAVQRQLVDVDAAGLFDPVNVVRTALRNAVSGAVMAMLTEALVIPRYRYLHADPHP
jgi:chaperonin GroEL (HSP60 family)